MTRDRQPATGNLPTELTTFVGRRRELDRIKSLLSEARLVTLTGLGGTGKTRLALRVAAQVRRAFHGRVWFVDLTRLPAPAPYSSPAQQQETLAYLIAATLGLRGHEPEPLRSLVDQLDGPPTLLVLDNCEHLISASATVVDALLRGCPNLRTLATSREPLAILAETLVAVPPLPVPDPGHCCGSAELARSEAVALFVERGRAVVHDFDLTADNQTAVAGICHRLDGLPLAIELAAARLRLLSPQQILDRLGFSLLSRGPRGAAERHQTLERCIAWSYELCDKPERLLWSRLAVFAGGFDLDAAEGVCADDILPVTEVLHTVAELVDKSIVVREDEPETARYRMLTTIQDYGLIQLRESGEESALRLRHAGWYLRLAEEAEQQWFGPDQIRRCRQVRREHPNLRAAFDFFLADPAYGQQAVHLAASLWYSWLVFGQATQGSAWLRRALEADAAPTRDRAKALWASGHLATVQGDLPAATSLLHEAHDLARQLGDELTEARAWKRLGAVAMHRGDLQRATAMLTDALTRLQRLDTTQASTAHALVALTLTRYLAGDLPGVVRLGNEVRSFCQEHGDQYVLAHVLNLLARAEFGLGDLRAAAGHLREAIRVRRALPDAVTLMFSIDLLSWVTAATGDQERAATLAGAAEHLWQKFRSSVHRWQFVGEPRDQWERRIRRALGDAAYDAAVRRGAQFTVEEMVSYALAERAAPARRIADRPDGGLTVRERQIAELIAQGLSNKEIAAQLVIGRRTAESHVDHILRKLAFTSRAQVAAWVQRLRDDREQAR